MVENEHKQRSKYKIKVKIMWPWDPSSKVGSKRPLPDHVSILDPKEQRVLEQLYSEQKGSKAAGPEGAPQ